MQSYFKKCLPLFLSLQVISHADVEINPTPPFNQRLHWDQSSGLLFPKFTKPFLEIFKQWEMDEWEVFEWRSGESTLWLSSRCNSVVSVDSQDERLKNVEYELNKMNATNVVLKHRLPSSPYSIGSGGEESAFVNAIDEDDKEYDCIIIDGDFHRNTCAKVAFKHIKQNGVIILNNANQASFGLDSWETFELLNAYEHYSIWQPGHPDWRTDYWIIR